MYDKEQNIIDEAIILYFKAPNSFTGEDIIEFQIHGGVVIASIVLDTVLEYGARMATAGEFSKRAFLNNKIDFEILRASSFCSIFDIFSSIFEKISLGRSSSA
ncbi:hypothetical protein AS859_04105 [Aliarcobacter cryaerophilus]|uniref:GTP-binding protein TrmE N-terminal domain-containing protein n=1 Tax=Aliarcobacter cryaerophilus TaxID=28198 RepID=A0A1V9VCC1_9BACT|nr:hypothetical protein AS859_04105 [Aliarcobacter cryaerophilus]